MKKTKILIADDNGILAANLEIQFLVYGFDVVTCVNADLAVAHAQKQRPDVMLVDIWMDSERRVILSKMGDGLRVLERIKMFPETSAIPLIYMTGDNSTQLDLRAKQMGAYGLIHKPINFPALLDMVNAATKNTCACTGAKPDAACKRELQTSAAVNASITFEVK